jgi:methyl-accepting chemotaxis protein
MDDKSVNNDLCRERMDNMKSDIGRIEKQNNELYDVVEKVDEKVTAVQSAVELTAQSVKTFVESTGERMKKVEEQAEKDRAEMRKDQADTKEIWKELLKYLKTSQPAAAKEPVREVEKVKFPWLEALKSKTVFVIALFVFASLFVLVVAGVAHDYLSEAFKIMGGSVK